MPRLGGGASALSTRERPKLVFGDGGAPLDAYLSRPYGLAIDSSDNIYIVDTYHHRVRVIYK